MPRTLIVAGLAALLLPVATLAVLVGGVLIASDSNQSPDVDVDVAAIPPLAARLFPQIQAITAQTCPELPPVWVIAEVQAESAWRPDAFSVDRNGGAAGLYQINQANWIAAGGRPWSSTPPAASDDILQPLRHLQIVIPWVCRNLRTATVEIQRTGKPTTPLDGMLVCHIAGCSRVSRSASGTPRAGEAGCDARCAGLVARYVAHVHQFINTYTRIDPRTSVASALYSRPGPIDSS